MRALLNVATDLVDMELHGLGVGERQCASGADPMRQADCTGQKCTLVALIGALAGPRAAPGPLPHGSVLLADAGFILEPQFNLRAWWQVTKVHLQRAGPVFLNSSIIWTSCAGCCGRALTCEKSSLCSSFPT